MGEIKFETKVQRNIEILTIFINLATLTFYKIHMGDILMALKAASVPVSSTQSQLSLTKLW